MTQELDRSVESNWVQPERGDRDRHLRRPPEITVSGRRAPVALANGRRQLDADRVHRERESADRRVIGRDLDGDVVVGTERGQTGSLLRHNAPRLRIAAHEGHVQELTVAHHADLGELARQTRGPRHAEASADRRPRPFRRQDLPVDGRRDAGRRHRDRRPRSGTRGASEHEPNQDGARDRRTLQAHAVSIASPPTARAFGGRRSFTDLHRNILSASKRGTSRPLADLRAGLSQAPASRWFGIRSAAPRLRSGRSSLRATHMPSVLRTP